MSPMRRAQTETVTKRQAGRRERDVHRLEDDIEREDEDKTLTQQCVCVCMVRKRDSHESVTEAIDMTDPKDT